MYLSTNRSLVNRSSIRSLPSPRSLSTAEALEQFKLAVVRHRASSWSEISQEDMLSVVEAMRLFVLSRAE